MENRSLFPLSILEERDHGIIIEIQIADEYAERIQGMGFFPGEKVEVLKEAPLGDPVIYRLGGTTVTLRREITSQIMVEIQQPFSLHFAQNGQRIIIASLVGGKGFQRKMTNLGILEGKKFTILPRNASHPVGLRTDTNQSILIPYGFASRIKVALDL